MITILSIFGTVSANDAVRIMDDGDAGFKVTSPAAWPRSTLVGFNGDYLSAIGLASGSASWSFSVNPGQYRISMTWFNAGSPYNAYYSTAAPVTVSAGGVPLLSTTINLRTSPADLIDAATGWKTIGVVDVTSAPLVVTLSPVASLYVIADAVRIERTDGTPITSPTVTSTSPLNSPLSGGIPVTIRGTQFTAGMRVLFGGNDALDVNVLSSTEILATAPPNPAGVVDVTVLTPDGMTGSLFGRFKYAVGRTVDDSDPGFSASSPASTVLQLGFQNDYVLPGGFSGATATWTLPVNSAASQSVSVTWPNSGPPYNAFYSDNVRFDVMDGTALLASIQANEQTTPNDFADSGIGWKRLGNFVFTSGQAKVVLRNNAAKYLIADAIRVEELAGPPAPVISSVSPGSGPLTGGTAVTITGSGFENGAGVKFGTTPADSVIFNSSTTLTATAPAVPSGGTVSVSVENPDGQTATLASAFSFLPSVSVVASDALAGEPGTGQGTGTFTVSRTGSVGSALTVNFTVAGTAASGTDYSALGNSVTIPAGSASAAITIDVIDDAVVEGSQSVVLTLANSASYIVGSPASATVSILDDDATPSITVLATDPVTGEPGTGRGAGTFTFSRTGSTSSTLTVFFTIGGTAVSGSDYSALGTSVTFASGSATAIKTVNVIDDNLIEGTQTVILTLGSGSGYIVGTPATATVTILDDDLPTVTVAATVPTAGEPGSGQGNGTFTVIRTGPTSLPLVVNFTAGGTATSGSDYTALGTSVTIPAGAVIATIPVAVLDDSIIEGTETVVVSLNTGTGYAVGVPSSATVSILDDDLPTVSVASTQSTAGEPGSGRGTGTFTFTRTGPAADPLTVNFTVAGTAASGSDYVSLGTSVSFAIGSSTATKTVTVIDDTLVEATETVVLTVGNGAGYIVGTPAAATVTIIDDDLPVISVSATDSSAGEPGSGQGTGTYTFTRTGPVSATLTVNFTVSGTATSGVDYTALGSSVTFAAGAVIATKTVSVLDDTIVEGNENVILALASGTGYSIGSPSSASISIQDDDTAQATDINLVTGFTPGLLANNFSGWLGSKIRTGAAGLEVSGLGRIYKNGDSRQHELRLIDTADQSIVASVIWTPAGGIDNEIKYAALASPVTLVANKEYYLVSREESGGDSWYHYNTIVTTTGAATVVCAGFSSDGSTWTVCGANSSSFVPMSLQYRDSPSSPRKPLRAASVRSSSTAELSIKVSEGHVFLNWPSSVGNVVLEGSAGIGSQADWHEMDVPSAESGIPIPLEGKSQFYRLRREN